MDEVENKFGIFRKYLEAFVSFTDEEWGIFQSHLRFKNLRKKETLIKQGKICTEIGFVLSGVVRFFLIKNGEEITNYFAFEHELVSSYQSFLTQQPSIVNIDVLEDTELIVFTHHSLQTMLANSLLSYKMERFGRLVAENLICCYEERVLSFMIQTPEERYLKLLQNGKAIIQRIPQHYIAHYLGITPVSLSRIRKRIMEPIIK